MSAPGYIPGDDWGRVCDVCGRLRPGRGFRVVDDVWICDRHPSYVPRQILDRVPYQELGAPRPLPSPKPFAPVDTYEVAEAQILNLMGYAPASTLDVSVSGPGATGANTVQAAAWAGIYLYELLAAARRPARWDSYARTRLAAIADWLYANQKGGPATPAYASSALQWGAYDRGGEDYYSEDSAAAGLALLRAYQVSGVQKYLDAARACAWFLRSAQCGDKLASRPSSTDAAGASAHHFGVWTHRIAYNSEASGTYDFDHRYYAGDLIGLEFLAAWQAAVGDETIGSSTTNAVFNASRAAAVSTAVAEALAFWNTGVFSVDDTAVINGLSSSTPREFFDAYPSDKGLFTGRGSWQLQDGPLATGTLITSLNWAVGLRALRAVSGEAAVTGLFDWLMTFTSNSAFEATTVTHTYGRVTWNTSDDRGTYAGIAGTYSPKRALATLLKVRSAGAAAAVNGSSLYDLATAGLLAPLYSSRQQVAFAALKDVLVVPRPRWREGFDPRDGQMLYLGPLGICGLTYQPYTSAALGRQQDVRRAAMVGGIYRVAPQAYTARGHAA